MSNRVTINLTQAAVDEIDRIVKLRGWKSRADAFRTAMTLLRIHVDSEEEGNTVRIDKGDFSEVIQIPH